MTLASTVQKVIRLGNGAATVFSFSPIIIFAASDLLVTRTDAAAVDTVLTSGSGPTNYTLGLSSFPGTGSITFPASGATKLATGEKITIQREVALVQTTDLENQGGYFADVQEGVFDYLTAIDQQQQEQIDRTLRFPASDIDPVLALPPAAQRAGQVMLFDSLGNPTTGSPTSVYVSSAMQPVVLASSTGLAAALLGRGFSDSMANFRLSTAATLPSTSVYVKGYYVGGDRGGGVFLLDPLDSTSPDDGGVLIVDASGRRWKRDTSASPMWSMLWFGAKLDGVTDDTAAIQAAVLSAQTADTTLAFPHGTAKINGAITVSSRLSILGNGLETSVFLLNTANMTGIAVTTASPVKFEGFRVTPATGITGTTAIKVAPTGGPNAGSVFRDLQTLGGAYGLVLTAAYGWLVDNVGMQQYTVDGLTVANTFNGDQGDSVLANSYIQGVSGSACCVRQYSSGGLKISNCKMLTSDFGYLLDLAPGVNSSDTLLSNNSLELIGVSAIQFQQQASSGSWGNVVVTGNQFAGCPESVGATYKVAGWLEGVTVVGNHFSVPANGIGINLDGVTGFMLSGNTFVAVGSNVGGMSISSISADGVIGQNTNVGLASYRVNNSSSTVVEPLLQIGTAGGTTSSGVGALYSTGAISITFPVPYLEAPKVLVSALATNNGVSAAANAITPTGFSLVLFGATTGAALTGTWTAAGH